MYDMYRENILDHGMNPRNKGILDSPTIDYEVSNPLCGDRLRLTLRVNEDRIVTEIGWDGEGCAISQAAASMLGEEILGKSLDDAQKITQDHVFDLLGIPISQNRVKCALLGLKALHIGIYGLEYWRKVQEKDED
jgi:nitrogen fixation NifU-like protein